MQDDTPWGYILCDRGNLSVRNGEPGDVGDRDARVPADEHDRVPCSRQNLSGRSTEPTWPHNHERFVHAHPTIALTPTVGAHTRAPMAGSMRMERVARQVQMTLAEVLIEGLKDPRYRPVTVTHVKVSPDLRHADVRFMPLGQQGDPEEIASVLNAAAGYLQREVGRRIRMKFTPRFRFHVDTQGEEALYMQSLLSDIRSQLDEE